MSHKDRIKKKVVKELLGYVLTETEDEAIKWNGSLCRKVVSEKEQRNYALIILRCMQWKGLSIDSQEKLQELAISVVKNYLHFKVPKIIFQDMWMVEPNDRDEMGPNLNKQLVAEILIHAVLCNEYNAVFRSMLLRVCGYLSIPLGTLITYEHKLLNCLEVIIDSLSKKEETKEEVHNNSKKKTFIKTCAAGIIAGALCGFAAPVLLPAAATLVQGVASVTALIGGASALSATLVASLASTAAFLSTSAGLTIFTTGVAVGGAGYGGKKMYKRLDSDIDFRVVNTEEFLQQQEPNQDMIRVHETYDVLLINGTLTKNQTALQAWGFHPTNRWFPSSFPGGHVYMLDWESELLEKITTIFFDSAIQTAYTQFITKFTKEYLLKGILVFPPVLLGLAPISYLDNVWSVAKNKAKFAGLILADQLLDRDSNRPLSIVAYSIGCCAVLSLLNALYKKEKIGFIENVYLLGCPSSTDPAKWTQYRQVVSGRFVNGYSKNDGMLYYLHRIESGEISVAGLTEVPVEGVENVDLSMLVSGHADYNHKTREILSYLQYNSNLSWCVCLGNRFYWFSLKDSLLEDPPRIAPLIPPRPPLVPPRPPLIPPLVPPLIPPLIPPLVPPRPPLIPPLPPLIPPLPPPLIPPLIPPLALPPRSSVSFFSSRSSTTSFSPSPFAAASFSR